MNRTSSLLLTFIAGAATGAVIGFLMSGGKIEDVQSGIDKLKKDFESNFEKGKDFLSKMKNAGTEEPDENSYH